MLLLLDVAKGRYNRDVSNTAENTMKLRANGE